MRLRLAAYGEPACLIGFSLMMERLGLPSEIPGLTRMISSQMRRIFFVVVKLGFFTILVALSCKFHLEYFHRFNVLW